MKERDFNSVKASLPSNNIPDEHIDRILTTAFSDAKKQKEEMSTSSGTVVKGLIATLISSILAGALLTGVYLQTQALSYKFTLPTWFFCYGIIWLFTQKTKKNKTIWAFATVATVAALLLAVALHHNFAAAYYNWVR